MSANTGADGQLTGVTRWISSLTSSETHTDMYKTAYTPSTTRNRYSTLNRIHPLAVTTRGVTAQSRGGLTKVNVYPPSHE